MKPTMVQFPPTLIERLDARARADGTSRSELIRVAVRRLLDEQRDEQIATSYRNGYEAIPAGTADKWGDVSEFHEALRSARDEHRGGPHR